MADMDVDEFLDGGFEDDAEEGSGSDDSGDELDSGDLDGIDDDDDVIEGEEGGSDGEGEHGHQHGMQRACDTMQGAWGHKQRPMPHGLTVRCVDTGHCLNYAAF
jgi:hypothetical protein